MNYGDEKSSTDIIIKYWFQPQLGSGLDQYTELRTPSRGKSLIYAKPALLFISLPSDRDELVDQLKLLYFEKVGGSDNPMLCEQITAIVQKLLENECITTNQHQNIVVQIHYIFYIDARV